MRRIAVVEDNRDNRLLVHAVLGRSYAIDEYRDGREALAGMRREVPDLVLLDISLPVMDGEEVLRTIRADEQLREVPVIAFTAHAMPGDRERFLAGGFNGYLMKPLTDITVLRTAVERWLPPE